MGITYNLDLFERAFAFQVLGQSHSLSEYVSKYGPIFTSNGWKVVVDSEPEIDLTSKTIYLRGEKSSKDLKVDRVWDLHSNYQRDKIAREIRTAIDEVNSKTWKTASKTGNPNANVNQIGKYNFNEPYEQVFVFIG